MEDKEYLVKDASDVVTDNINFSKPKSYSIIAMNLETTGDVERVIRQCESIKKLMSDG